MSILGSRVVRSEDPKFLTTGGVYCADLDEPLLAGAGWVTYVRSQIAHGRIVEVDVSDARGAEGVLGIYTAADLGLAPAPPDLPMINQAMPRPWLATDVVRFVGEPIVAIVTEHPEQGPDAAEAVIVDIDPLPAVVDMVEAANDERLVHEAAGTNIAFAIDAGFDDTLFDGCEVVVTADLHNQRVAGCPLEVRGGGATWADGRLHVWCSTQSPQAVRDSLLGLYGLEPGTVRVIAPDVGGGFGPKIGVHAEEMLLPWLARAVGRPVRWTETRSENMQAMGHGRAQRQTITIGGSRDGHVQAYRLDVIADCGAYPKIGAFLPFFTRMMTAATYAFPKAEFRGRSVVTNTMSTVAYRGAGRPEATAAAERAIDLFALEIGLDPAEVRRRNLIAADAFPFTTAMGTTYDSGDYAGSLDRALDAADYDALRAEQARRRAAGEVVQLGIGVSVYVEVTAGPMPGGEHGRVEVKPDGTAVVYTGTSPHGQGHATSWAMLAADTLGLPFESVTVVHGDTDLVPDGVGTFGSRSLQLGGSAVRQAAEQVVERAKAVAADVLEANAADIVLDSERGGFSVVGSPAVFRDWSEVATAAAEQGNPLDIVTEFKAESPTYPFGAHVAVVDVDTETGKVTLTRMVTCDDAGVLVNPMLVEGQRHGGIAQGVAQALFEELVYDADGNPTNATFAEYGFPSAAELPSFELVTMETRTPVNPLGAKGIGESGTIGSTPAVQSAVCDALTHLGVRHVDMPCTPQAVWTAIEAARG